MYKLLLIAVGGALGTLARYGTVEAVHRVVDRNAFPYGTVIVNLIGCFVIGYLQGLFLDRWTLRPEYRLMLLVGFLGGFTTFSSFGWDTMKLLQEQHYIRATVNVLASNVGGIALVIGGYALARVGM